MALLRKSSLLTKIIIQRYKCGSQSLLERAFATKSDDGLNLLNEPVVRGPFLNPIKPLINLFKIVWFRYTYDNNFDPGQGFADATKKVFAIVTEKLHDQDFDGLKDLVTTDIFSKLKTAVGRLSDDERSKLLGIKENDVFLCFLYNCGSRLSENNPSVTYFDLVFVFSCIRDIEKSSKEIDSIFEKAEAKNKTENMPRIDGRTIAKFFQNRHVSANLRLSKKISPSVDTDWTVSYVNYALFVPPGLGAE